MSDGLSPFPDSGSPPGPPTPGSGDANGSPTAQSPPKLIRGVGLAEATALNMIDMIGVGPFITIPLIIGAMGGPQAMIGWVLGAGLAICDGLVWAELGAAMPRAGGPYNYLKEIYGPNKLGRLMSFIFIWQLNFSAPLSIASGCIGFSQYGAYLWPGLSHKYFSRNFHVDVKWFGALDLSVLATTGTFVAMATVLVAICLLYRRITVIGLFSKLLWAGVLITILWVIVSGVSHFDPALAFSFPEGAFELSPSFFTGLGLAMLFSIYDYWGYYNVCFLGEEVKDPGRTIPRAIIISTVLVGAIYIVMNTSILGVLPWQEIMKMGGSDQENYVVSVFMQRIYGDWAGYLVTILVMWTAFASVFSLILGYSRVPYAAALDGNYFKIFSRLHPKGRFPYVSLLVMGGVAMLFCFFRLKDVIGMLVVVRIMIQFLAQIVGVIVLRIRRPDMPRPFRMWLYPVPALIAFTGFVYVLFSRKNYGREIRYGALLLVIGLLIFFIRSWRRREWPFRYGPEGTEAL